MDAEHTALSGINGLLTLAPRHGPLHAQHEFFGAVMRGLSIAGVISHSLHWSLPSEAIHFPWGWTSFSEGKGSYAWGRDGALPSQFGQPSSPLPTELAQRPSRNRRFLEQGYSEPGFGACSKANQKEAFHFGSRAHSATFLCSSVNLKGSKERTSALVIFFWGISSRTEVRLLRFLRMVRILRLAKISRMSEAVQAPDCFPRFLAGERARRFRSCACSI